MLTVFAANHDRYKRNFIGCGSAIRSLPPIAMDVDADATCISLSKMLTIVIGALLIKVSMWFIADHDRYHYT